MVWGPGTEIIIPGSWTQEIINASKTTNDGTIGRWHFRVDCSNANDCIGLLRSYYFSQQLLFFEYMYVCVVINIVKTKYRCPQIVFSSVV